MQETQESWVQSLGLENSLEEEMTTHSSSLAWRSPCTEEPGRIHSRGSQKVRQDRGTKQQCSVQQFHLPANAHHFLHFFIAAILKHTKWYHTAVLMCISLMISYVEHLSICLLAICVSSLEKCLFKHFNHF